MDKKIESVKDRQQQVAAGEEALPDLQNGEHAWTLLNSLALLRRDASYCDVLLQAEGATREAVEVSSEVRGVWAHRVVLAAASPLFYNMFHTSFDKCSLQVLVIKDMKLETLQTLIDNIYSSASLALSVKDAKAVFSAAKLLEVADVQDAACVCLVDALTANNVLDIRDFASLHHPNSCITLSASIAQYIRDHFEHVLLADELLALSSEALAELLKVNEHATDEVNVLDAVLRWTQHRPQERRQHLASLLQVVRLQLIPRKTLVERTCAQPLASAEPHALFQIAEALTKDLKRPECPSSVAQSSPWSIESQPRALLVMGGWTNWLGGCTDTAQVCSLPDGFWQPATALPAPRVGAGAAVIGGNMYLVGGYDGSSPQRTVFVYDTRTGIWSAGPQMTIARRSLGVAALAGRLYAVGTLRHKAWLIPTGSNINTKSAEALDLREGVWRSIPSMIANRGHLGVAVLDEKLYAVGGYNGHNVLNSVERYDPVADRWQTVEKMTERRHGVGMGVLDGVMYAVGGKGGGLTTLQSVEQYCEGSGWTSAPSMPSARCGTAVLAHNGKLYAAGGTDNGLNRLTTVSMLDPTTAAWSELPTLYAGCSHAAAVVIPWREKIG